MSVMTVFMLVLMLLSVNTLWVVKLTTARAIEAVKSQVNVSVYFSADVSEKVVSEITKYLKSFPEVVAVDLLDSEAVLRSFQERHKMSPDVLAALNELGGNPFGPTVIVKTREPGDYLKVVNALDVPEYRDVIEAKSFDEHREAIAKIQNITTRLEKMVLGLSALFALIAFLVIFNTIRVAINGQKMEIGIKRLVGASNWFIRGPYLVESVFFTILSVFITGVVIFASTKWLDGYLGVVFGDGFSLTNYYFSHILSVFGLQILAVLILTSLSSLLAMRRQLKV